MNKDSGNIQSKRNTSSKIGELLVELELTALGWHVERLDGAAKAANGDLIAIKGKHRVVIQVKSNGTQKDRAYLGHAGRFLQDGASFYNSKHANITTDIVVSVTGGHKSAMLYVFTVEEAETFARNAAEQWFSTPKIGGGPRSPNFPVSPKLEDIEAYLNRWDKLENIAF